MNRKKYFGNPEFEVESSFIRLRSGDDENLRYGYASTQGLRNSMEDAVCALKALFGGEHAAFFGVFDGHGGSSMARIASETLLDYVLTAFHESRNNPASGERVTNSGSEGRCAKPEEISDALRKGFVEFDADCMLKRWSGRTGPNAEHSGTTATVVVVTSNHIITANLGDSRSMLVSGRQVAFSTSDHKPSVPIELARIEANGGFVKHNRVNGVLAISRTFGDFSLKREIPTRNPMEQIVSCVPDIQVIERSRQDEFIVVACDGLWDVASCEKVQKYFSDHFSMGFGYGLSCDLVVQQAIKRQTSDNVTVMVIGLPGVLGSPGTRLPEINSITCDKYYISMWNACATGNVKRALAILEAGFDVDTCTLDSTTETSRNVVSHVKDSLAQLCPELEHDVFGWTCMMVAALTGNYTLIKLLVKQGASVNASTSKMKHTALMIAAIKGHKKTIMTLISLNAKQSKTSRCGKSFRDVLNEYGHDDLFDELCKSS